MNSNFYRLIILLLLFIVPFKVIASEFFYSNSASFSYLAISNYSKKFVDRVNLSGNIMAEFQLVKLSNEKYKFYLGPHIYGRFVRANQDKVLYNWDKPEDILNRMTGNNNYTGLGLNFTILKNFEKFNLGINTRFGTVLITRLFYNDKFYPINPNFVGYDEANFSNFSLINISDLGVYFSSSLFIQYKILGRLSAFGSANIFYEQGKTSSKFLYEANTNIVFEAMLREEIKSLNFGLEIGFKFDFDGL